MIASQGKVVGLQILKIFSNLLQYLIYKIYVEEMVKQTLCKWYNIAL